MPILHPFSAGGDRPNLDAAREQAALLACLYQDREDMARAVMRASGGPDTVILWHPQDDTTTPARAILRQGDNWYFVCAGTRTPRQWLRHFAGIVGEEYHSDKAFAHPFFREKADLLLAELFTYLPDDLSDVSLRLSGHSFGAGIAFLMSLELARRGHGGRTTVMTFGEPRCLTAGYPGPFPELHVRFVGQYDPVPQLPPSWGTFVAPPGITGHLPSFGKGPALYRHGSGDVQTDNFLTSTSWAHFGTKCFLSERGVVTFPGFDQDPGPDTRSTILSSDPVYHHSINTYFVRLIAEYDTNGGSKGTRRVQAAFSAARDGMPDPYLGPEISLRDYADLQRTTEQLFPPDTPQPDWSLIEAAEFQHLSTFDVSVSAGENIHDEERASVMASGYWKMTFFCTNKELGKSFSVVWASSNAPIDQAFKKALALIDLRSYLLGSSTVYASMNEDNVPNLGTPSYTHVRIADALNPRIGQLFKIPVFAGSGSSSDQGNSIADHFSTAVSYRLRGKRDASDHYAYHTETFVGIQDATINGSRVNLDTEVSTGPSKRFGPVMREYLNLLTLAGNRYGFMGQDPTIPKRLFSAWEPDDDGYAIGVRTAHGLVTDDKVRVTESKVPGFNGIYRVDYVDANTVRLRGKVVTVATSPVQAKLQLVESAAGVRQLSFFAFQRPEDWNLDTYAKVSKRNVARPFSPVSFPRRRQRA